MPFRQLVACFAALTIAGFPLIAQSADAVPPVPGMTGEQIDAQAQIDAKFTSLSSPSCLRWRARPEAIRDHAIIGTWPGCSATRSSQAPIAGNIERSKPPSSATCV